MEGFASDDLRTAFLDVEIQARGTKAEAAFFHCYTRLAPGEQLDREQWQEIARRELKTLGFAGQAYAVAFHTDRATGHTHMHMGISRIARSADGQLFALDPGLYKNKLKELSRTLEKQFALKEVSNVREPQNRTRATGRKEFEQARRLGTGLEGIRNTIRDCWQQADSGAAFRAALDAHGLILARGDRRDFVVIDQAGGDHALSKRITDATAAQTRDRLAGIDRAQLPDVKEAKARQQVRAGAQKARQRAEPEAGAETRAGQERAADGPEKRPLGKTAGEIQAAWNATRNAADLASSAAAFRQAIEDRGPILVYVTADEAQASERARAFAKAIDRQNRALKEGFAVVDERGAVTRIDQRTTGDLWHEIEQRLASIDRSQLLTVAEARDVMKEANRAAWADAREQARPASAIETAIAVALTSTMTGTDFAAALDENGLTVARVTAADVLALDALRDADRAAGTYDEQASGRRFADIHAGELAAVTRQGDVFRLSPQKLDFEEIEQRLADVQTRLPTVVEARALNEIDHERKGEQRAQSEADFIAARIEQADAFAGKQELRQATRAAETVVHAAFETPVAAAAEVLDLAGGFVGSAAKIVSAIGDFLGGLFGGPKDTKAQAEQKMKAATNEETLHARDYAATVQAKEAEFDDRMHAQKTSQQEQDLSFSARFGTPPTREANIGREHDNERERERD